MESHLISHHGKVVTTKHAPEILGAGGGAWYVFGSDFSSIQSMSRSRLNSKARIKVHWPEMRLQQGRAGIKDQVWP